MYNQAFKQLCLNATFVLQYDYVKITVRYMFHFMERIKNNEEEHFVSQTTPRC